ncbi:3-phenylpropionate/trans-cinnamate dioxygenase ferredoxin reductase subunit [Thalassovita taeanensis]|uniref:3-phenylpropionate/trans-cinnamate dioxygenase ferredoxin reductase subunit n=2 Tax=Thalassovita taeanensis TaxID=657014 RepID=A0A1H9HAN0_9RHOB|nr:3-phenylpropionate/trans-cinnamate dioxygenase ferredoxin reductase subunit [Thalassovita taeanensis]
MIGDEADLPYQRPPLSKKYLTGEMERSRLHLRPQAFFDENDIDIVLGTRVTRIALQSKTVHFDGESLEYDALVLATGSTPRKLEAAQGGYLSGIHYMRTLSDIDAMEAAFKKDARLLIIGGGYIGLETAAVAASRGVKTTIVEAAPRILQRVASDATADFFRQLHKAHGVDIRENTQLIKLTGTNHVNGADLGDGTHLEVDFVIAGIGVLPVTSLADEAGLEIENGIKVDGLCRTSDQHIFAAGDCASFPYADGRIRLESVPNAIDQGNIIADVLLGSKDIYVAKPWFWSDQYDVKLQISGLNSGYDHIVVRAGEKPNTQSVWYFTQGRLIAVEAMNDPKAYMTGKRWIDAGKSPRPADIADQTYPLRDIVVQ